MVNSGYAYCSGSYSHDSSYLSTVRLVSLLGNEHLPALPSFKLDTRLVNTAIFKNCITNGLRTRIRIPTATSQTCHATWLHHTENKCNRLPNHRIFRNTFECAVARSLERVEGVEPSSLAWKARVIAVIRHPLIGAPGRTRTDTPFGTCS